MIPNLWSNKIIFVYSLYIFLLFFFLVLLYDGRAPNRELYIKVCMYACRHVCMYACRHVCMYACMHVDMYACMHVCM